MDLGLAGKVALVSGASRGIGRRIACALAEEGVALGICARGQQDLNEAADQMRGYGVEVFARLTVLPLALIGPGLCTGHERFVPDQVFERRAGCGRGVASDLVVGVEHFVA